MSMLYIDGSNGISGNTLIGAFISLGLEMDLLKQAINQIITEDDYILISKEQVIGGRKIVYFNTEVTAAGKVSDKLSAIEVLMRIRASALDEKVKKDTLKILDALFLSKAEAHRIPLDEVEFNYEGMTDTIIDAIGTSVGLKHFDIEKVSVNRLNTGFGIIKLPRYELKIPAPMTRILLQNYPTYQNDMKGELVTPTGAAIIHTIGVYDKEFLEISSSKIGYGLPEDAFQENLALRIAICD